MAEPKGAVVVSLQGAAGADARRWLGDAGHPVDGDAPAAVVVSALDAALAAPPAAPPPGGTRPELIVVAPPHRLAEAVALLRLGASDILVEPLEPATLLEAVSRAAARSRAAAPRLVLELARAAPPPRVSGMVAHEIANPVAVLVSALAALESDLAVLDEGGAHLGADGAAAAWWARAGRAALADASEAAGEAAAAVDRLKQLAADLRNLQRSEPSRDGDAPTDVGVAAASAVRLARPLLAPVARLAADTPPGVSAAASPGAVVRVVLELLLCALDDIARSRRRGALVRVASRAEPGFAVVEVEADVPPGGPAAGQDGGGLEGVGRAVAHDLAALLGGTLTSSRTPAGGTLVALRLKR